MCSVVAADAERVDVRMLEQQQVVVAARLEQRVLEVECLAVGHAAQPPHSQGHSSASQSRVSMISLTFTRKWAA